jgi:hypothetical protein
VRTSAIARCKSLNLEVEGADSLGEKGASQ